MKTSDVFGILVIACFCVFVVAERDRIKFTKKYVYQTIDEHGNLWTHGLPQGMNPSKQVKKTQKQGEKPIGSYYKDLLEVIEKNQKRSNADEK